MIYSPLICATTTYLALLKRETLFDCLQISDSICYETERTEVYDFIYLGALYYHDDAKVDVKVFLWE